MAAGAGFAGAMTLPLMDVLARLAPVPGDGPSSAVTDPAAPATATTAHRWVMVIDLRSCDGCGRCTQACQTGHYLDPQQEWIKVYQLQNADGGTFFMPRSCMQCQDPPCLRVCPTGATFATIDGLVLVDQSRCIGCRMCMAACPYEARYFNWSEPTVKPSLPTVPTPEFPAPQIKGTVGKCVLCVQDIERGKLPFCVEGCPMHVLWIGDVDADIATNGVATVRLSAFLQDNDAVRYKEELNTRPSVYYILGHGQNLNY
jgi:molybdopterin-containing oxidoreductase family iron-sulfur binding subunit